jgi:hypothetical protein
MLSLAYERNWLRQDRKTFNSFAIPVHQDVLAMSSVLLCKAKRAGCFSVASAALKLLTQNKTGYLMHKN